MKRTILFLTIFSCLFTACSKSGSGSGSGNTGNPQPGSGSTDLIKSISIQVQATANNKADTITTYYTYDAQGRCTESIEGKDTTYYTYTSRTLTSTQGSYTIIYYLNAAGTSADSAHLVVSILGYSITTLYTYSYDANGYLIRRNTYQETAHGDSLEVADLISYTNGNLTQDKDTVNNITTLITYNNLTTTTAPLPPDPLFGAAIDFGPAGYTSLLGHGSTNLIASLPEVIGPESWTINFAYTLDNKNRISTVTQTYQPNTQPRSVSYYTYY